MKQSRRKFIQLSTLSALSLGFASAGSFDPEAVAAQSEKLLEPRPTEHADVLNLRAPAIAEVRVGIIGLGNRGMEHLRIIQGLKHKAQVLAVCDLQTAKIEQAKTYVTQTQQPKYYSGDAQVWQAMLRDEELDLVIIATPWADHVPMAKYAMEHGAHVALEVPAAMTVPDCWQLVDHAEQFQKHCVLLENVCYGNEELWLLNMAKQGVLGELSYAAGAYIHDLRALMFSDTYYYDYWRLRHHVHEQGNLYPTHGLGPIAQYMDIARGDTFHHVVSMESPQLGLQAYANKLPSEHPFADSSFVHGDMNMSLIKTEKGKMIQIQHDVVTPRPYSRINALGGTKGFHQGYPSKLSLAEVDHGHKWLDGDAYAEMRRTFDHPIWADLKEEIELYGGHGGMDFVQLYRLIDNLQKGKPMDIDVYDTALWCVLIPLSRISVEMGNVPVRVPDFTRGKWNEKRVLPIIEDYS